MSAADTPAPLRLGFTRGTAPNKWAERWHAMMPGHPLELVAFEQAYGRPAESEEEGGESPFDIVLERCAPGARPEGSDSAALDRAHHAILLYEEDVALVLPRDHELARQDRIHLDELALVTLLAHPDHASGWPAPAPWSDPAWMPADLIAALELVTSGIGGILAPLPLARHLAGKREHAVLRIVGDAGDGALPGSTIWATWRVDRDAPDVQQLVGIMRGRTARSSRSTMPSEATQEKPARKQQRQKPQPRTPRGTRKKR